MPIRPHYCSALCAVLLLAWRAILRAHRQCGGSTQLSILNQSLCDVDSGYPTALSVDARHQMYVGSDVTFAGDPKLVIIGSEQNGVHEVD